MIEFLRQYKIGPFSIFDFAISYIGFYLLSPLIIRFFMLFKIHITKSSIMWLVLPLSVVTHIIIRTYTPLTLMTIDPHGHYIVKIIMLFMLFMGLRKISF